MKRKQNLSLKRDTSRSKRGMTEKLELGQEENGEEFQIFYLRQEKARGGSKERGRGEDVNVCVYFLNY